MPDRRSARQQDVLAAMPEGADAMVVSHPPNVRWLTGFTGSAGFVVLSAQQCLLITDFRYAAQAPVEVGSAADVLIERFNLWDRLKRVLGDSGHDVIAAEGHVLTHRDFERMGGMVKGRVIPTVEIVETLRQVKDRDEIAAIRDAGRLASEALASVVPTIAPGDREIDIAARLEAALRTRGSEWHPFQTIVASGPRAALPHARSSRREVGRGELLLIDYGATVDGYCSDVTRTFAMGEPDDRQRVVYDLVRESQLRARGAIRAGMSGRDADALARDVIASRGYGDAFGHSLGHGIGLEVHEAPRLAVTAEEVLPAGTVVAVEPGIYLAGWGGVRLEDDIVLTPDGPVLLTDGHTELVILKA